MIKFKIELPEKEKELNITFTETMLKALCFTTCLNLLIKNAKNKKKMNDICAKAYFCGIYETLERINKLQSVK